MIPFDKIYSWLFKSFRIGDEISMLERLQSLGYKRFMVIKRSWIFILFVCWIPLLIILLSGVSIGIAYVSISIKSIQYTIIIGNILMSCILIASSFVYIRHFREINPEPYLIDNLETFNEKVRTGKKYFRNFFNWSLTNQFILYIIIIAEILLIVDYNYSLGDHFLVLGIDTGIICTEIFFLQRYRKKMIDLEMDFAVIVAGRMVFINQTGVLSETQTIESNKIKTIRAVFPSKIASFFNYGQIVILTEGDLGMVGTIKLSYITSPVSTVRLLQSLVEEDLPIKAQINQHTGLDPSEIKSDFDIFMDQVKKEETVQSGFIFYTKQIMHDTQEKIKEVLRR